MAGIGRTSPDGASPASLATSTTAPGGTLVASAGLLKARMRLTFGDACTAATSAMYNAPDSTQHSSGTGPQLRAVSYPRLPGRIALAIAPYATATSSETTAGVLNRPASCQDGTCSSGREMLSRSGSTKWSTTMIIVAHGT